jgi:hypothetical protein
MAAVEIASTGWGTLLRPVTVGGPLVPIAGASCLVTVGPIGTSSPPNATIWTDNTRIGTLSQPLTTRADGTLPGFIDLGTYVGTWTIAGQAPFSHQLDMAGPTGAAGPPGVGANWRGVWSNVVTYAVGDGAFSGGFGFISNVAGNLNNPPSVVSGSPVATAQWSPTSPPALDGRVSVISEVLAAGTGVGAVDRPLVQAAIDAVNGRRGGRVRLRPDTDYQMDGTSLVLRAGVVLGNDREFYTGAGTIGPRILGTAGVDTIALTATGGAYEIMGAAVEGVSIVGGRDAIAGLNGAVGVAFRRLKLTSQGRYSFNLPGFVQECVWDNVECEAGQVGIYAPNLNGSSGAGNIPLWDKNALNLLYCHGQTVRPFDIEKPSGYNNVWTATRVVNCVDGLRLAGGMTGHTFLNLNCEGNGYLAGATKIARAVGSMVGTNVLTLTAANPGYAIGDVLTVKGLGNSGSDLTSAITGIANGAFTGSLITLTATGGTGSGAEVTKATACDILLATSAAGTPSRITFIDALIGGDLVSQDLRYAADISGAALVTFIGGHTFLRTVYDPNRTASSVGGSIAFRRPGSLEAAPLNVTYGSGPPTGLSQHTRGERIYHDSPSASGTEGWVCVTTGTPGTWKTFGSIAA